MNLQDRGFVEIIDRATATYAPNQIGRTQYMTPEGFLLCQDARIARTGSMLYTHREMRDPKTGKQVVQPPPDGSMIVVTRDAEQLFNGDTVASFSGKPVTNNHPSTPGGVTPANFKQLSVGTVLNPRQGAGPDDGHLVCDLLITDAQAIKDVKAGKRELSPGYDTEVEQVKPGLGRQTTIIGNHVALVARGRGGSACSIQDKEPTTMAKLSFLDKMRLFMDAVDDDNSDTTPPPGDGDDGKNTVHVKIHGPDAPAAAAPGPASPDAGPGATPAAAALDPDSDPNEARFQRLEASVAAIAEAVTAMQKPAATPPGDPSADPAADPNAPPGDKPAGAADGNMPPDDPSKAPPAAKAPDEDKVAAQDAMSKAELLAPGIKLPARDAKAPEIVKLQRDALTKAYTTDAKPMIEAVLSGRKADFGAMPEPQLGMVFDAAAALVKQANNSRAMAAVSAIPAGAMTAARMQERIVERRIARREGKGSY